MPSGYFRLQSMASASFSFGSLEPERFVPVSLVEASLPFGMNLGLALVAMAPIARRTAPRSFLPLASLSVATPTARTLPRWVV